MSCLGWIEKASRSDTAKEAETLLQALTICCAPRSCKSFKAATVSEVNSSRGRKPYGACFVSPKYKTSADGKTSRRAFSTVSPPTPESKIPIIGVLVLTLQTGLPYQTHS